MVGVAYYLVGHPRHLISRRPQSVCGRPPRRICVLDSVGVQTLGDGGPLQLLVPLGPFVVMGPLFLLSTLLGITVTIVLTLTLVTVPLPRGPEAFTFASRATLPTLLWFRYFNHHDSIISQYVVLHLGVVI